MEITFQYISHAMVCVAKYMSAQKCNTTKRYKRNCNFAIDCFKYVDSVNLTTGLSMFVWNTIIILNTEKSKHCLI